MEIFKLNPLNPDISLINEAIDILSIGGVILYPTDTVYGLGANIFDKYAVKRIYNIKKRSFNKPLSICVSNVGNISLIANVSQYQMEMLNKYLPGAYTFLLNKKSIIPNYITPNTNKIGVRVPNSLISNSLSSNFPIVTTSANISNENTLNNPKDIIKQLDYDLDLVIDIGTLDSKPSTIIDLTDNNLTKVRK